jgi:capsular exopolysaccharide synthesis family protein
MLPEVKEKKILITEKWRRRSRYQEEVYSLQNRVDYLMKKSGQKVLLVTSTEPSEGKTTIAVNLALAMAQRGEKVLLIDGDLRKLDIQKHLLIPKQEKNMNSVLNGTATLEEAAAFLKDEGLYVLKGDKKISNPVELIHSNRMKELIRQAREFADVVIIDTAGRLHNKVGLMNELTKIKNVMQKVVPDTPHEVLLVLDGSTGQNAYEQAKQFIKATEVTSLAVTKLDGTAKGGVVIGISHQLKVPVKYIGLGEKMTDLQPFNRRDFVDSLFTESKL